MYCIYDYIRGFIFFSIYGSVKYLPSPVGDFFRWLVLKFFLKKINSMRIKDGATFWFPYNISIGKNVSINEWCFLDGFGGIEIGDDCRIAHGCSIISEDHMYTDPDIPIRKQGKVAKKITIGKDCWLGANVKILKGVTIGEGCIIGAGSIVTKDISPYCICVGVPAKVIKKRKYNFTK